MFFARPEGVSGLKLAVFEDFNGPTAIADVSRLVEHSLGPEWYPFVRVRSKDNDEATLIYASPSGGKLRMMIVNLESSEATVVELKLSEHGIKRWLEDPKDKRGGVESQSSLRRQLMEANGTLSRKARGGSRRT